MVVPPRPQPTKRGSMRPPPRPNAPISACGRSESPAESISSGSTSRARSPSAPPSAGTKRKERDFDRDAGEETNINVVVRCRGRSDREVKENSGVVVSVDGLKGRSVELSMGPSALSNKTYHFDKVFSPAADQAIIFDDVVKPILSEMLTGYNCTIFAYGQTGTGKTYTMSGDMTDTMGLLSDAAGIIPRVLYTLFQKLETDEVECSVKCSFIELYNEELRDLLSVDDSTRLKIYDDNNKKGHSATLVQGMEESHIKFASEGIKLLQAGSHRRQVAATKCNELSSRSHTVFTITTYIKKSGEAGEDFICAGKLNLVDLAGSENIQRSGAENKRAAEAGVINKSLLTLGRVINALVDKSSHIPYRESKLTRLLQDSLGGRTKTYIIATVSPAKSNLEETISTLDYAFRAKNIRNKPQANSTISKKTLLKEFTTEIEKLKGELIATRQRNGVYLSNEQFEGITIESESRRILSEEQGARIGTLEVSLRNKVEDLFALTNSFNSLKRDNDNIRVTLENTKDLLLKTELVLRDTEQVLREEEELRKAHQATEEQLHGLGTRLITKLDESVLDLSGVHSKLRRRSDLHLLNRQSWESSAARIAEVTKNVDNTVENFRIEQSSLLTGLSDRMGQFMSLEIEKVASNQTFLRARSADYERVEAQVKKQSSGARDDMNQVLEEIKVLREEVKGRVGDGLSGLSAAAARISAEVICELEQFHTQLHLSYSALGRDFKSMFEDVIKHANSQRDEADELRKQLEEANEKIIASNTAAASSLENCISDERQASQQDRDHLLVQIKSLMDESAKKQDMRLSSGVGNVRSELTSSRSEFERAGKVYVEGMSQWSDKERSFVGEVGCWKDSMKNKMKKDWTDVNSRNTAIQNTTKAVHNETVRIVDAQLRDVAVQMAALDEFVTRAREQNGHHYDSHCESLEELSANVRETFGNMDDTLQATSKRICTHGTESKGDIETLENNLSPFHREIQIPLVQLGSSMQSNPLTDYEPTGETPQKKDWVYPTTLPRTDSHNALLAKVRGLPPGKPGAARSPRKTASPRKMLSPRKGFSSPCKLPSPTKTRVFLDDFSTARPAPPPPPSNKPEDEFKAGLKEMNMNVLAGPFSTDDLTGHHHHPPSSFSKSVSSMQQQQQQQQQPPLKRHATAESRLPRKGRENIVLNQSAGPGAGLGRRLRSSPQQ